MQGPKWPLFYSHVDPVWSLIIVGTGFVPWVELPVQRRLCPIFVSGVGLPDIHEYSARRVVNETPRFWGITPAKYTYFIFFSYFFLFYFTYCFIYSLLCQ